MPSLRPPGGRPYDAAAPQRRRRRKTTIERPISGRLYRAAWIAVAAPLLIVAFSVARPEPLPEPGPGPTLELSFDQATAVILTLEMARKYPDRVPGTTGAEAAEGWMIKRFGDVGLKAQRDTFVANLPGLGKTKLTNVAAVAPGPSPGTIIFIAHRDNTGTSPGANDNASGTGALLELARNIDSSVRQQTVLFLSTDGGAYGGAGAKHFAEHPEILKRFVGGAAFPVAVVVLDAISGSEPPVLLFNGDSPRSPAPTLTATASASVEREAEQPAEVPRGVSQLVSLAFPFTLHEQGPFVTEGVPAITITTGGERATSPEDDTITAVTPARLGELGRAAQDLMLRLDASPELAQGTQSYIYVGDRLIRGWAIQLLLISLLIPVIVATVDLFARCRRRHVSLIRAFRSLGVRAVLWLWIGLIFGLFALVGLLAEGGGRPIDPGTEAANTWPVVTLIALLVLSTLGWLAARPGLAGDGPASRSEELGGHLAGMLVLIGVSLVVAAVNPYALIFVLPSLHAWLWIPHVPRTQRTSRFGLYLAGFAGLILLVVSFAVRLGLGLDAIWYLLSLVSSGYVALPVVIAALVWAATAQHMGAIATGTYAPYSSSAETGPLGQAAGALRARIRRRRADAEPVEEERRLRSVD